MIQISEYSRMLENELEIVRLQSEGLTDSDIFVQPLNGGNCLAWVLGHIADGLVNIQKSLGGRVPASVPGLERYGRGSEPILRAEEGLLSLTELLDLIEQLNDAVQATLAQMEEVDFEEEIDWFSGKERRGWCAFFMFFHYTYHIGQLEFLRNLAGKTEKII